MEKFPGLTNERRFFSDYFLGTLLTREFRRELDERGARRAFRDLRRLWFRTDADRLQSYDRCRNRWHEQQGRLRRSAAARTVNARKVRIFPRCGEPATPAPKKIRTFFLQLIGAARLISGRAAAFLKRATSLCGRATSIAPWRPTGTVVRREEPHLRRKRRPSRPGGLAGLGLGASSSGGGA